LGSAARAADWNTRSPSADHTCTTKSKFSSSLVSSPVAAKSFSGKPERSDIAICCM